LNWNIEMIPVIAIVGRPNVGKSTIFNKLTKTRDALVADWAGLTRDRKYGEGKIGERPYILVDTGGISGFEEGLDLEMASQSYAAIEEADKILFVVDAREGVTGSDRTLAEFLRKGNYNVSLVVNKTDGLDPDIVVHEFHELGLGLEPKAVAAAHNRGIRSLIEDVLEEYPAPIVEEEGDEEHEHSIKLAIVGRPNVGKSTLVNRILGEERVVVYDKPGTTMDSVYIPFERDGQDYTIIDTAGVRRRKNITEAVEKFSIIKSLQAIQDANVVILVVDAQTGLVEQDMHMLGFVLNSGRAIVIAINKWDGMSEYEKDRVKVELDRRMSFMDYADTHFISALHGTNVGHLYDSVIVARDSAFAKWKTNRLTEILEGAVETHQPPLINGRRIKLRYAHQGGSNPPVIVVHGNQTNKLPGSYKRFLENSFRKVLGVRGTGIRFEFKSTDNPYAKAQGRQIN
jgi:GTPase